MQEKQGIAFATHLQEQVWSNGESIWVIIPTFTRIVLTDKL
jgi:hypothetical protein